MLWRSVRGTPVFLLLRNVKGHWDFPKGHVEEFEELDQTIRREVAEETGLSRLVFHPAFRKRLSWVVKERGRRLLKMATYRLARVMGGRVRLSPEHRSARWEPSRAARRLLGFANQRDLLAVAAAAVRAERPPAIIRFTRAVR